MLDFKNKYRVGFLIMAILAVFEAYETDNYQRYRRSPFKKHRVIVDEIEPEIPSTEAPVSVEHHHHYHKYPPPPRPQTPPPPPAQKGVHIEFNKGKWKGDNDKESEEIKKAIEDAKEAFERDKQEKFDKFKGEVEDKLDFLAKIPEKFASDLELIGSKIKEDLDKKKDKDKEEGISIEIWKKKGKGGGRRKGENSREEIHHHHYYGSSEEVKRPPLPPPKKSYEDDAYYDDTVNKFADMHTQFMSFLEAASNQYRVPPPVSDEEGESNESSRYGGKGKGFHFSMWKAKGGRRRK